MDQISHWHTCVAGQTSPGSVVAITVEYKANMEEAESCDSYEDQPKAAQQRTGKLWLSHTVLSFVKRITMSPIIY